MAYCELNSSEARNLAVIPLLLELNPLSGERLVIELLNYRGHPKDQVRIAFAKAILSVTPNGPVDTMLEDEDTVEERRKTVERRLMDILNLPEACEL